MPKNTTLADTIYVRLEKESGDDSFLLAHETLEDHAPAIGDIVEVGVYRLIGYQKIKTSVTEV